MWLNNVQISELTLKLVTNLFKQRSNLFICNFYFRKTDRKRVDMFAAVAPIMSDDLERIKGVARLHLTTSLQIPDPCVTCLLMRLSGVWVDT